MYIYVGFMTGKILSTVLYIDFSTHRKVYNAALLLIILNSISKYACMI